MLSIFRVFLSDYVFRTAATPERVGRRCPGGKNLRLLVLEPHFLESKKRWFWNGQFSLVVFFVPRSWSDWDLWWSWQCDVHGSMDFPMESHRWCSPGWPLRKHSDLLSNPKVRKSGSSESGICRWSSHLPQEWWLPWIGETSSHHVYLFSWVFPWNTPTSYKGVYPPWLQKSPLCEDGLRKSGSVD